ncbi:hypothetical protein LOC67_17470 [Stieleria sp. JC731]|uniref:hypothetical protein n=1 Tax=Pirellulaceae TaxID=2691357 RepID=UPI001E59818C|nr:hypothetical protein [Stieleria sp. JC731]MCC9602347.1 hypothetical protein [Stieleria sp. JC731]
MSLLKKITIVALVVVCSQVAAPQAKAGNPLEKMFASAGKKVVGGAYNSVQKNVTQSTKLILKTAPYALLQGSRSGSSRTKAFSGTSSNAVKQLGTSTFNKAKTQWRPSGNTSSFGRKIFFSPGFRR